MNAPINLKPARPLTRWMGGKRRLLKYIAPLIPEHECYVELFFGGGAVFFGRPEVSAVEVINDLDSNLINLYRVAQKRPDELVEELSYWLVSRELFDEFKTSYSSPDLNDVERAARFYYVLQYAFAGRMSSPSFGASATKSRTITPLDRVKDRLADTRERLSRAIIECLDWQEVAKRYDREHTFFYAGGCKVFCVT